MGEKTIYSILILLSMITAAYGFLNLKDATWGIGIIAFAGVLAIWARISQAAIQHKELKRRLEARLKQAKHLHEESQ